MLLPLAFHQTELRHPASPPFSLLSEYPSVYHCRQSRRKPGPAADPNHDAPYRKVRLHGKL